MATIYIDKTDLPDLDSTKPHFNSSVFYTRNGTCVTIGAHPERFSEVLSTNLPFMDIRTKDEVLALLKPFLA